MAWLDSLITGVVQLGGSLGGSAIKGSFEKQKEYIAQQGAIAQTGILAAAQVGTLGGGDISGGYLSSQIIAAQLGERARQQAATEQARIQAAASQRNMILIVVVAAASLFVLFLIVKR